MKRPRHDRGMTLVELMIVVAIVGVLASMAMYVSMIRYLASAKTSEAKHAIGGIARSAIAAYEREASHSELINEGSAGLAASNALCESATPVPANLAAVKGRQYQPSSAPNTDFATGDALTGWKCLTFSINAPMYYQYSYTKGASILAAGTPAAVGVNGFEAGAQGDIDGDGTPSRFAATGEVNLTTGNIHLASHLFEADEFE